MDRKVRLCPAHHLTTSSLPSSNMLTVLLPPINFIFKLLQQRATVSIWLYENLGMRIEGKLRVPTNADGRSACALTLTLHRVSTSS